MWSDWERNLIDKSLTIVIGSDKKLGLAEVIERIIRWRILNIVKSNQVGMIEIDRVG